MDLPKPSIPNPNDTSLRPFPHAALREVLSLRGNEKCCDCFSIDASWASVNHGILLCLECAGRHRSLGVQNSFIRSVYMDTWSQDQVEMMLQGGNSQLHEYFEKLKIETSAISVEKLYQTRASAHYREKLREKVCFLALDKGLSDFCLNNESNLKTSKSQIYPSDPVTKIMIGTFAEGPLGMTLAQSENGGAYVSCVSKNGCAEKCGITEMDVVISVAGRSMTDFEEIMDSIPFVHRPMRIEFSRTISGIFHDDQTTVCNREDVSIFGQDDGYEVNSSNFTLQSVDGHNTDATIKTLADSHSTTNSSVLNSKLIELDNVDAVDGASEIEYFVDGITIADANDDEVVMKKGIELGDWMIDPAESFDRISQVKVMFTSSPMGLTLSMNELGSAEVTKINPGGNAEHLGIKVGDMVINVNRRTINSYDEAMKLIKASIFPLEIVFRRVNIVFPAEVEESAL